MGADAPIPPIAMNAAAPDGAPPRRIRWFFKVNDVSGYNLLAPPCRTEALRRGAIVFSESVHSWFLNVKLQNIWKTRKINKKRMQVFAHLM